MNEEKPILFKGDMVVALLDNRKTQTRRMVRLPLIDRQLTGCEIAGSEINGMLKEGRFDICPHGKPGDRLWVKETWVGSQTTMMGYFKADLQYWNHATNKPSKDCGQPELCKWKSPLFMPRWASRITLQIISIHAELLNNISEEDAIAEGAMYHDGGTIGHSGYRYDYRDVFSSAKWAYVHLWESINGNGSWKSNPWVWVLTFQKL